MSDNREVRDELAMLMGWKKEFHQYPGEPGEYGWRGGPNNGFQWSHPAGDDTIDSAAACLPEEYMFCYSPNWASTYNGNTDETIRVARTGDEKADRFQLALLAWRAMKGKT